MFIPPCSRLLQSGLKEYLTCIYTMSATKVRGFSIVLHNVRDDSKSSVEQHFQALRPTNLLVAMEPYPQGEGHHIHVFVSFKNTRQFTSMLNSVKQLSTFIVQPRAEGEVRDWGRVQVDRMYGSFEQATAYLTNPQKDKICDSNVTKYKKGDIICDVCACIGTPFEFAADYPCGKMGRCRRCICVPHRMYLNYGFKSIRNLDHLWL